jgi:uncharacterized protein YuzE
MTFYYDQELDQLAVQLVDRPSVESAEVAPGFVVDFDSEGRIVGFEVEHASKQVDLERLTLGALPVSELLVSRVPVPFSP